MGSGGRWDGISNIRGFITKQVELSIQDGRDKDASMNFILAMMFGGKTTKEALALIRDRDCKHLGYNIDIINADELPDFSFMDAWSRSQNGGPVTINIHKAKDVRIKQLESKVYIHNDVKLKLGRDTFKPNWDDIYFKIQKAQDINDLMQIDIDLGK